VEKGITGSGSMYVVWQSLRNIRQGQAGIQPVRPKLVHRNDGQLCCGPVETLERWHKHFQSVLSIYNESTINLMPVLPLRNSMESPLTLKEIWEASSNVNSGKATT